METIVGQCPEIEFRRVKAKFNLTGKEAPRIHLSDGESCMAISVEEYLGLKMLEEWLRKNQTSVPRYMYDNLVKIVSEDK